jgi:hypothetical protein
MAAHATASADPVCSDGNPTCDATSSKVEEIAQLMNDHMHQTSGNTNLSLAMLQQRANIMVDEHIIKNNASQRIFDLLGMIQDMFTNLENFDTCLNAEPEYKIMGGVDFMSRLVAEGKNFGEMFDAITSKYLTRAIVSGSEWIVEELDIEIEKIKQGLLQPMSFDMLGGLESLLNGSMMVTIIDEAWSRAERLYERPGWLPLKCSFAFVFGSSKQPLIDIVTNFVPHVITPAIDMIGQAMVFVFNEGMETLGQITGTKEMEMRLARLTAEAVGDACIDLLDQAANDLARARFQEDEGIIAAVEKEFAAPMKAETVAVIIASILSELLNDAFHTLSKLTFNNIIQIVLATCRGFSHVGLHILNWYASFIPFVGAPLLAPFTTFVDIVQGQFFFYAAGFINQAILDVFAFFTNKAILAPPITLAIKTFNFVGGLASLSLNAALRLSGIPGADVIGWIQQGVGPLLDAVGGIASWAMPNIANALDRCSAGRHSIASSSRVIFVDILCANGECLPPHDITGIRISPGGDENKCMEYDETTKRIIVVQCTAGSKQRWFYDEITGKITNGDGSLCLQPARDGSGAVSAAPCNGNDNQKWKMDGGYIISHGGDCVTFGDDDSITLQECTKPTEAPTAEPTEEPADEPTEEPTEEPAPALECHKKMQKRQEEIVRQQQLPGVPVVRRLVWW